MLKYRSFPLAISFILFAAATASSLEDKPVNFARQTTREIAQNNPPTETEKPQQQPPTETTDPNRIAAEKAEAEAKELLEQKAPYLTQIAKQEEALKYWRLVKDRQKEAETLNQIAGLYLARGEYPKALAYAQQALPIFEALDDRKSQVGLFPILILIYEGLGEYQKAIDIEIDLQKNIPLLFPDDPELIPGNLLATGITYGTYFGDKQKAIDYHNQALAFWQENGDVVKQAEILEKIALVYLNFGEITKSLEIVKQINDLDPEFKRGGDNNTVLYFGFLVSGCSDNLAFLKKPPAFEQSENSSETPTNNNNNTIENLTQQVQKYRTQGYLGGEASLLEFIGSEYRRIGEYQRALEVYQQALELRQLMGAKPGEAETLTNMADLLNQQGKKQEAINKLNQALEIQRQLKTRSEEADTLLTIGDVYLSLGAYPQTIETYKQALSIFQDIGDRSKETDTLNNIGNVYKKLQNYPQALNSYQQAVSISQNTGNCFNEAVSLVSISSTYLAAGDYQQAIRVGNETLTLSHNLGIPESKLASEAGILGVLARVENKQGNYAQSLEYSQKSRKIAQELGAKQIEGAAIGVTAETYEALKQPKKALQSYQEQLSLYRQTGLLSEQAQSLYNIAKLQRKQENLSASLTSIDEAIEIIENIRKEVASPELRTSFFASKQDYYELKINILMELHKKDPSKGYDAQAFDTSERSRARTLVELLKEANIDIRQGVEPQLLAQENALKDKSTALEKRWVELINKKPTEQELNALKQQRNILLSQSQDIQSQIRAKSPKYAALTQPQPLKLAQVQQQILDEDTVLLQYFLGTEKSYLWVVTKTGITTYQLPPKKDIEPLAQDYLALLNNPSYDPTRGIFSVERGQTNPESPAKLSQILLGPASQQINAKRLLIVPDGILEYIPFSALPIPNDRNHTLLLNQYEIVNSPSTTTLGVIREQRQNQIPASHTLAIFADPVFSADDSRVKAPKAAKSPTESGDLAQIALARAAREMDVKWLRLPGTRQEANAILSMAKDNYSALDFDANLANATNPRLSQYRILHFATHGMLNSESPELSGVVLSLVNPQGILENGFLRLQEIFNLNLPGSELVVLSACQTGLGESVRGEGLVGLTRGFMYAGSPRVLVSLWNVSDEATAEMMKRFYRLILEEKLPPAQALRKAQMEMREQTKWKSPYYWAAFTIQGEWR